MNLETLPSSIAGTWYTANPASLRRELEGYLQAADAKPLPDVHALILPHAGYQYSGAVAAHGVRTVQGARFRRVIILGPSHRVAMPDTIALPKGVGRLATPLGTQEVDHATVERLAAAGRVFQPARVAFEGEHSVEIELPFLQAALADGFAIVPLVVGQLSDAAAAEAGRILAKELDAETLLVASSDFTHYGPRFDYVPFEKNLPEELRKLDLGAFEFVQKKDAKGFRGYVARTGATICGRDPISVLLHSLPEKAEARLLKYDTSGRITGEWDNSVSYVAAAFTFAPDPKAPAKEPEKMTEKAGPLKLAAAERTDLLRLARGTIEYYFANRRRPTPRDLGIKITPGMEQTAGAFVTLHKKGDLRGCIGEIVPTRALHVAVLDQALNSAFKDPRFEPVRQEEMKDIDVEISALSEPWAIDSWKKIELGRHGIILRKLGRSAVFLPQVAPEQGWTVEETLSHLAMKAGLPPDAWKDRDCRFEVFEATVFGEKKP